MKPTIVRHSFCLLAVVGCSFLPAARAGEPAEAPRVAPAPEAGAGWEFALSIYSPLMGLEGDVGVAGLGPSRVDVPFEDIWDNLDGSLSGAFEARYDRWSITADAIWLKLSAAANPIASSYLRFSQEELLASLSVGYEIYGNDRSSVDLVVGAALTSLDMDLDLFTPNLPVTVRSGSGSQEWIDPFIGLRVRQELGDRWTLFANGVYGGFEVSSDEYWQVLAGIGYRLNECTTLALAYRVIAVDYRQGGFLYDTETSGPNLGLVIRF